MVFSSSVLAVVARVHARVGVFYMQTYSILFIYHLACDGFHLFVRPIS